MPLPPIRESLTQRVERILEDIKLLAARVLALEEEFPLLKSRMDKVEAHNQLSTEQYDALREILSGAVESIDHLANNLTLDEPLQEEIRVFITEQREAKRLLERKTKDDAIFQAQVRQEEIERRQEVRRVLTGVLVTATLAIGTYLVKQLIPRFGDFVYPIAIIGFLAACIALVVLTWTGAKPKAKTP